MDLRNMIRIVTSHFVIVTLALLATVAVAGVLVSKVEPEFEANASVVLLPPGEGRNPLENPTVVAVAGSALLDVVQSPSFVQQMVDAGLTGGYEVGTTPGGGGAIVTVRTVSPSAEGAFSDVGLLLDAMATELSDYQSRFGISEDTQISFRVLAPPSEATAISGSKARVLAITLSLGIAGVYALAAAADALYGEHHPIRDRLRRRRQNRVVDPAPIVLDPTDSKRQSRDDPPTAEAV